MTHKIRVFIADDHHIFRKGILSILKDEESFEVIGEASEGNAAIEKIRELKPDIALLDLDMPGLNGLEIAGIISKENLPVKVAILTMHKEKEYFTRAMEIHVKAFLLKDKISDDLIECLKTVAENKYFISPQLSTFLIDKEKPDWLNKLTSAEINVLRLLAENKTSKQISEVLFNSIRTIENHRNNICKKLNLTGQNALLLFAAQNKQYLN